MAEDKVVTNNGKKESFFNKIITNRWTYLFGSIYAIFGLYNFTPLSIYGWVNSLVHRAFLENSAMHDVTFTGMVESNPMAFAVISVLFILNVILTGGFGIHYIRKMRIMQTITSIAIFIIVTVILTAFAPIFDLIPLSKAQAMEMFAILFAFLGWITALIVIGYVAFQNYRLNPGYIFIPIILIVLQIVYIFSCMAWPNIMPDFTFKNFFISSQFVWTIIYFFGFCLLLAQRKATGQLGVNRMDDQDEHDNTDHSDDHHEE